MQYLGGKAQLAKPIAKIVNTVITEYKVPIYYEPFAGALNVAQYVNAPHLVLSDAHEDLILMWQAVMDGWVPPEEVSREEYQALRNAAPSALRGFVGFACSFGGKWFGGYARNTRTGVSRSYAKSGVASIAKKLRNFQSIPRRIDLVCCRYNDLVIEPGSFIYCDPPYANTTKYSLLFDSIQFWDWVRRQSLLSYVLVSEYAAPDDFICANDFVIDARLRSNSFTTHTEKLFIYSEGLLRGTSWT